MLDLAIRYARLRGDCQQARWMGDAMLDRGNASAQRLD